MNLKVPVKKGSKFFSLLVLLGGVGGFFVLVVGGRIGGGRRERHSVASGTRRAAVSVATSDFVPELGVFPLQGLHLLLVVLHLPRQLPLHRVQPRLLLLVLVYLPLQRLHSAVDLVHASFGVIGSSSFVINIVNCLLQTFVQSSALFLCLCALSALDIVLFFQALHLALQRRNGRLVLGPDGLLQLGQFRLEVLVLP